MLGVNARCECELDVAQPEGGLRRALEHLLEVDRGEGGEHLLGIHTSAFTPRHSHLSHLLEVDRGEGGQHLMYASLCNVCKIV